MLSIDDLEITYVKYLFDPPKDLGEEQKHFRPPGLLHFFVRWIELSTIIDLTKKQIHDDNNIQGYNQIDTIQMLLINEVKQKIVPKISGYVFKTTAS